MFPAGAGEEEDRAGKVMAELQGANTARSRLLKEEQDWEMEKQRLELLRSTIVEETRRLRAAASEDKKRETELRKKMTIAEARQQRLTQIEAMVDALAERLEKALEVLSKRSLPGLIPPDTAAGIIDPSRRLAAAAGRLDQAHRRARASGIEIVEGRLDKEPVTIKLLRAGGAAAWWISLDGKRAGTATVENGSLVLKASTGPNDIAEIRKAFSIVSGQVAPDWVTLPAHHIEAKPEK
jgi:hypothetical protein